MNNTNAFYILSLKRREIEESMSKFEVDIMEIKEDAKKEPKGSQDRKDLMQCAKDIEDCEKYKILKAELSLMNFCINTVFY